MRPNKQWWQRASGDPEARAGWPVRALAFVTRLSVCILRKLQDEKLHLQLTGLAYMTLLSLVPFLAVTFSALKGFGVQNQLEPILMRLLVPLGEGGTEVGQHLLTYVGNRNFAVLGFFGIALLFWTVVSLLSRVEKAFNSIWHVPGVRSWSRRFSDYLSVVLVGPVFLFAVLGVTAIAFCGDNLYGLPDNELLNQLVIGLGRLVPYLLICAAFTFLYSFLTKLSGVPGTCPGRRYLRRCDLVWYRLPVPPIGGRLIDVLGNLLRHGRGRAVRDLDPNWLADYPGRCPHRPLHTVSPFPAAHPNGPQVTGGQNTVPALDIMTAIGRAHYFDEPKWMLESLTARDN